MLRLLWVSLVSLTALGCAGSTDVEENPAAAAGGSAGSGAGAGKSLGGGSGWASGGSASGSGGSAGSGAGAAGSAGSPSTKPYDLHAGRTYDQESDYVAWDGQVSFVTLKHKDQTSLPASEGGASCSGGCDEQVTRIEDGASVWGKFTGLTGINVQLASTDEAGVGQGVFSVCGVDLPAFDLAAASTGLPGFNNLPSPAHAVSPTDDCEWRVKAVGGFVYFRAVTVTMPAGSGGTGGSGGAAGSGGGPA